MPPAVPCGLLRLLENAEWSQVAGPPLIGYQVCVTMPPTPVTMDPPTCAGQPQSMSPWHAWQLASGGYSAEGKIKAILRTVVNGRWWQQSPGSLLLCGRERGTLQKEGLDPSEL